MPKFSAAAALFFLTAAAPLLGAEDAPLLTWQDCLALAAQNNPDLQSAQKSYDASRANYRGSYNSIFPSLSLTNSYSESGRAGSATSIASWSAGGSARLSVFNWSDWANIRGAGARLEQSGAGLRSQSASLLLDLYSAFAGLLYAQEQIRVSSDILGIWRTDAQLVSLRYDSGRESKGNKMRTDAQLLQAQSDYAQALRDLRVSQQVLNQAVGRDQFQALAVTGSWTWNAYPDAVPNFEALADQTPQVQSQRAALRESRAAVDSARGALFPNLSVNYSRGTSGPSELPTRNDSWTLGANLSYPIFAGGPTAAYFDIAAAKRGREKAEADLRSTRNQARSDLESAWAALARAQDQVRVQEAFLEAARQRRIESDIRYQNGLMSFEEWQLVVADLVDFERSHLRSQQNRVLAEAQWRFAQGQQLGD